VWLSGKTSSSEPTNHYQKRRGSRGHACPFAAASVAYYQCNNGTKKCRALLFCVGCALKNDVAVDDDERAAGRRRSKGDLGVSDRVDISLEQGEINSDSADEQEEDVRMRMRMRTTVSCRLDLLEDR